MANVQHKRGTRAALDALATAGGLLVGQIYFITDENRIAIAGSVNSYQAAAKQGEAGGGGNPVMVADLAITDMTSYFSATIAAAGASVGQNIMAWLAGDQASPMAGDELWAAPAAVSARCLVADQIEIRLASPVTRFRGPRRINYQLS